MKWFGSWVRRKCCTLMATKIYVKDWRCPVPSDWPSLQYWGLLCLSLTFATRVFDEIPPLLTQEVEVLPVLCILLWLCSSEAFLLTLQDPESSSIDQVLPLAADQAACQHQIDCRYGSQDSDQDCFREGLHPWVRLNGAVWDRRQGVVTQWTIRNGVSCPQ